AALIGFRRFPTWMWRNTVVLDFLSWLRAHNEGARRAPTVFHGMDLYNLYASMDAVVKYLERHDPAAAERARERYACFEMPGTGDGGEGYGQATRFGAMEPCEEQALKQLVELQRRSAGTLEPDLFSAVQKARLARNAEVYYRATFGSRIATWKLRDPHMPETPQAASAFRRTPDPSRRFARC